MSDAKSKGSKFAGGLLALVVIVIGVTRGATDQGLVKYHNDFVQKAYVATVVNGWNPFVEVVRADDATTASMAQYVKEKLLPPVEKWSKETAGVQPPEWASEFHSKFAANLGKATTGTKELLAALENEDTEKMNGALKKLNPVYNQIDADVAEFQTKLKDERDFTFESK